MCYLHIEILDFFLLKTQLESPRRMGLISIVSFLALFEILLTLCTRLLYSTWTFFAG